MQGKLSTVIDKRNFMLNTKTLRRGAIILIGFEFGLALVYWVMVWQRGTAIAMLDFNGLRSLPSLLQAAHLFAIGMLCLSLLICRQRLSRPCSWFLPLALAILCFYGGLDELTKLHLTLDQVNWKIVYLTVLASIPLLCWRDLLWVWREHPTTLLWIGIGMGIFLLGGFGAEMVKGAIASELAVHASTRTRFLAEHLRITFEEFAELIGETVILYAFARFTQRVLLVSSSQSRYS